MNLPTLLPPIYFAICRQIELREAKSTFFSRLFFDGIKRKDGSVALLSQLDGARIMSGMRRLHALRGTSIECLVSTGNSACLSSKRCGSVKLNEINERTWLCGDTAHWVVAWQYEVLAKSLEENGNLCSACATDVRNRFEQIQKRMWNDLPGMFELPSWEDIKRDERR